MELCNGMRYPDNLARAAALCLGTCAPAPKEAGRLAAYELIAGIYALIMRDASALGWKPLEDVTFEPWEQQRGREKDVKTVRDASKKVEGLIKGLFDTVEAGEAEENALVLRAGFAPGKTLAKALSLLGCTVEGGKSGGVSIKMPALCAAALSELAAISRAHTVPITDGAKEDKAYLLFSRVVFEPGEAWNAAALDSLLGAGGNLIWLAGELEKRGYERIDCRDGKRVSLDYVKQHGKKAEAVKMAWGERTHSGIEVSVEELRLEPAFIWLRMPMYKTVLAHADELPGAVRDFLLGNTKNCDGCRYCVQTDKTHTRPIAAISVGGKRKCPLYPGFSMNWRSLTRELAENILAALDAVSAMDALK